MTSTYAKPLKDRWDHLRDQEPKLRIRDAAFRLGVSEVELVALGEGVTSFRLRSDWIGILSGLKNAGPLMGLTRNEHAVHERHGTYASLQHLDDVCIMEGDGYKIALFVSEWATAFHVKELAQGEMRESLQFFDRSGAAVHKIYLTRNSRQDEFIRLVGHLMCVNPSDHPIVDSVRQPQSSSRAEMLWSHRKLVSWGQDERGRAVCAPELNLLSQCVKSIPIAVDVVERFLTRVASIGLPVMIAVGNSGALQIHSGSIQKIVRTGPWINVLDDLFNLHLRDLKLSSAYWVNELSDGSQSLCWLDADRELSLQIFPVQLSADWHSCIAEMLDEASNRQGVDSR